MKRMILQKLFPEVPGEDRPTRLERTSALYEAIAAQIDEAIPVSGVTNVLHQPRIGCTLMDVEDHVDLSELKELAKELGVLLFEDKSKIEAF